MIFLESNNFEIRIHTNFPFAESSFPIGLQPFSLGNCPPVRTKNTWRFSCQHETYSLEPMKNQILLWRFFQFSSARTCPQEQPWKINSKGQSFGKMLISAKSYLWFIYDCETYSIQLKKYNSSKEIDWKNRRKMSSNSEVMSVIYDNYVT